MRRLLAAIVFLAMVWPAAAPAADMDAETIARRVGQVFAGYDDFWVWVLQRFKKADGEETVIDGRAYFKRPNKFRLNFGQPPFLIEGTDGREYWVYDRDKNTITYEGLDDRPAVHPLLIVFAAGDQMVKALDKYFDVDALEETELAVVEKKLPAYKLVISLKPEALEEMREKAGNKLAATGKQTWTFWVDKADFLPRKIQVDFATGDRYTFELGRRLGEEHAGKLYRFYDNRGLDDRNFTRPSPPGVKAEKLDSHQD